jgi:hypothetical protein
MACSAVLSWFRVQSHVHSLCLELQQRFSPTPRTPKRSRFSRKLTSQSQARRLRLRQPRRQQPPAKRSRKCHEQRENALLGRSVRRISRTEGGKLGVALGRLSNLCFDLLCLLRSLLIGGLEACGEESVKKNKERIQPAMLLLPQEGLNSALSTPHPGKVM